MKPSKFLYYIIELLNCYGAVYYSNFIFFYMKIRFGFTDLDNLLLAALSGLLYIFAAWQGGAFAERFGTACSLYIGCIGMVVSLIAGLFFHTAIAQVVIFGVWTVAICFVWPALEAAIVENSAGNVADLVGYYNITWAFGGAVAYFTTGMLLERLGLQSLYWLPLCIMAVQIVLLPLAVHQAKKERSGPAPGLPITKSETPCSPHARHFLHLAWVANPLSYVAINTIIPLIPSIADRLGLSTGMAGIVCSIWMFMRLAIFIILRYWTKWHYHWSMLAGAFVLLITSFTGIILAPSVAILIMAQSVFGLAIGLVYYSSLYYAMMVSDKKGEHCGLHEAMIGLGLFAGPAFGAGSLVLLPNAANGGVLPVGIFLTVGFGALVWMRRAFVKKKPPR